jgi:hypothetical protein
MEKCRLERQKKPHLRVAVAVSTTTAAPAALQKNPESVAQLFVASPNAWLQEMVPKETRGRRRCLAFAVQIPLIAP